jgi:hypothetical protein
VKTLILASNFILISYYTGSCNTSFALKNEPSAHVGYLVKHNAFCSIFKHFKLRLNAFYIKGDQESKHQYAFPLPFLAI